MDWIDPRQARKLRESESEDDESKSRKHLTRRKPLSSQLKAALAQPQGVWSTAYGYALDRLTWPRACSAELTFQWSCCSDEQTAILMRCRTYDSTLAGAAADRELESTSSTFAGTPFLYASGWTDLPIEDCASDWLDGFENDAGSAFGVAALAWYLPYHAAAPLGSWSSQWLLDVAYKLGKLTVTDEDAAICHLVARCELPLLFGIATGASKRAVFAGAEEAMDNLALLLEQAEDQPAIWLAYGAGFLRAALTSVLRCRVLANDLGLRDWYKPQQKALAELLKHAVRWCRPDGSQLLGSVAQPAQYTAVWEALLRQSRKPIVLLNSIDLAKLRDKKATRKKLNRKIVNCQLPELSVHSEEARNACLLSDWRKRGGRAAIDYSDSIVRLEVLGPKGKTLFLGDWTAEVQLNGQSQVQLDDWERLCWYSDDDVDYLEIEAKFGDACRLQRQIMLFREDRLFLLADALLCDHVGNWSLSTSIPIASGVEFQAAEKTNEVFLNLSKSRRSLILPLGMPEWRRQFSQIELTHRDLLLSLQARTQLSKLYAPLLVSLDTKHADRPFTWRRLTVAEDLSIVAADAAAAYRAQIGKNQWLLYRTLSNPTRRTAMGMHTGSEFLAARFCGEDAEFETLVEVEADES